MTELLTPREAAAKLRCSTKTLNKHVAAGMLRYVSIGLGRRHIRRLFTLSDLEEFIAEQSRRQTPLAPPQRTDRSKSTLIPFSQSLRPKAARRGARLAPSDRAG